MPAVLKPSTDSRSDRDQLTVPLENGKSKTKRWLRARLVAYGEDRMAFNISLYQLYCTRNLTTVR